MGFHVGIIIREELERGNVILLNGNKCIQMDVQTVRGTDKLREVKTDGIEFRGDEGYVRGDVVEVR